MSITAVPVRAEITIGNIVVSTPYVNSFSVNKARGRISSFNASLKVSHEEVNGPITGGSVEIRAGVRDNLKLIFTGMVRTAQISPCWDDPNYVLISLSGSDELANIAGKKFTRRCRATLGTYCVITDVSRPGLKSGKFAVDTDGVVELSDGAIESQRKETKARTPNDFSNIKPPTVGGDKEPGVVALSVEILPSTGGA